MLLNLVTKIDSIWIVSCSWSNHTISLLMFVAEKVLLLLVISLTVDIKENRKKCWCTKLTTICLPFISWNQPQITKNLGPPVATIIYSTICRHIPWLALRYLLWIRIACISNQSCPYSVARNRFSRLRFNACLPTCTWFHPILNLGFVTMNTFSATAFVSQSVFIQQEAI